MTKDLSLEQLIHIGLCQPFDMRKLVNSPLPLLRKAARGHVKRGNQTVSKKPSLAMGTWRNPGAPSAYREAPARGVAIADTGVPAGASHG